MKSNFFKILLSLPLCFILLFSPVKAEENDIGAIKQLMLKLGFENIEVSKPEQNVNIIPSYRISYENRTFLHEIKALGALLSGLNGLINLSSSLEIFPQSNGKVISKVSLNYLDYLNFKNKKLTEEEFAKKVDISLNPGYQFSGERINPLFLHTDLVIAPSYIIDPINGPSILFSPYLYTYFDKGFYFNTRYSLPVYNVLNGFDYQKNFKLVPPGFTQSNIDYSTPVLSLPVYTTFRLSHFYLSLNQIHNFIASNELQYVIMDGKFNINLASGINFNATKGSFDFSILPFAQFNLSKLDLVFEGGAGKFLNNYYGGWGRVTRQFDNVDLGFSLYRTFGAPGSGWGMNFEYNLAIGPEHSINASPVRVTYPRFFSGTLIGGSTTGNSVSVYKTQSYIKRLYPEYIKTHLYYWKGEESLAD